MSKTNLTQSEYEKQLNKRFPRQYKLLTPFTGMAKPMTIECQRCHYIWHMKQARYALEISHCKHCHYPENSKRQHAKRQPKIPKNLRLKPGQKLTGDFFVKRFEITHPGSKIKLISPWQGTNIPTTFQCLNCGYQWTVKPGNLQHTKIGCPQCAQKQRYKTMYTPLNEVKNKIRQKFSHDKYKFLSDYHGTNQPITVECQDCHTTFTTKASHLYTNNCPTCSATNRRLPLKELQNRIDQIWGKKNFKILNGYQNYSNSFTIRCNKCHHQFITKMSRLINLKEGCPFCSASNREKEIIKILEEHHIQYNFQYHPKNLRNPETNAEMHLDFYLPLINTAIEHDGEQHFKNHLYGETEFHKLRQRDHFKTKWCKQNHIPLLRIKYTDNLQTELEPIIKLYQEFE